MNRNQNWKKRLYDAYVSSGQATGHVSSAAIFDARAPSTKLVIARHIPRDKDACILDLGCGYGAFPHFLKQAGYRNIRGIDASVEQVELAHRLGIPEVKLGDLKSCLEQTDSASVDVVLLIDVLEHLAPQELFDTLDDVFRILKRGGRLIAHVPNAEGLFGMRIRYGDLTHELVFTPRSAQQLFTTIGFSKVECHEDRPIIHNLKSFVRRIIWDLFTLGSRLLLTAETGETRFVLSQNMLIVAAK